MKHPAATSVSAYYYTNGDETGVRESTKTGLLPPSYNIDDEVKRLDHHYR